MDTKEAKRIMTRALDQYSSFRPGRTDVSVDGNTVRVYNSATQGPSVQFVASGSQFTANILDVMWKDGIMAAMPDRKIRLGKVREWKFET